MGMVVIPIAVIYIVISLLVLRFAYAAAGTVKGKCFSLLTALVLVLWYPVIDPLLSYYSFLSYAKEHAKVTIFKTSDNVKSVLVEEPFPGNISGCETHNSQNSNDAVTRNRYDFVEHDSKDGIIISVYCDGTNIKHVKPESHYFVRKYNELNTVDYSVYTIEIRELDGVIMATSRQVVWHGGHWMRVATDAPVPAYKFIPEGLDSGKFVRSVLRP